MMGCTTGIHNKELALFLNVKKKFNLEIIITEEKNHLSLSRVYNRKNALELKESRI